MALAIVLVISAILTLGMRESTFITTCEPCRGSRCSSATHRRGHYPAMAAPRSRPGSSGLPQQRSGPPALLPPLLLLLLFHLQNHRYPLTHPPNPPSHPPSPPPDTTVIKVVVLLFVCIVGYTAGSASHLSPFLNPAWEEDGVFLGSSVLFFSYVGFDALGTAAEEVGAAWEWVWGTGGAPHAVEYSVVWVLPCAPGREGGGRQGGRL